jgi:predicted outer membrane repeat protein
MMINRKGIALFAICCFFTGLLAAEPMQDPGAARTQDQGRIQPPDQGYVPPRNDNRSYYVSPLGNDENDGLDEGRAFKTLSRAVGAAGDGAVKRITLLGALDDKTEAAGHEQSVFVIDGSGEGEIVIAGKPAVGGNEASAALRGGGGKRVITVTGSSNIRFEHIVISGGDTASPGGGIYAGGGAVLTLGPGVTVRDNRASEGGGVFAADSRVYMRDNASIRSNTIITDEGGGVHILRCFFYMGDSTQISGNSGGGIVIWESTAVLEGNAAVTDNVCQYDGAGICAYDNIEMTLKDTVTVSGNKAGRSGGGIAGVRSVFYLNDNVTVSNNAAEENGGGIYAADETLVIIKGGALRSNSALYGGGGYVGGGEFQLAGGEIAGNSAQYGGGIFRRAGVYTQTGGFIQDNVPEDTADFSAWPQGEEDAQ